MMMMIIFKYQFRLNLEWIASERVQRETNRSPRAPGEFRELAGKEQKAAALGARAQLPGTGTTSKCVRPAPVSGGVSFLTLSPCDVEHALAAVVWRYRALWQAGDTIRNY